ncbi:hypothetical protein DPSP01_014356 [Paraphaeosphaeria sporulosa]
MDQFGAIFEYLPTHRIAVCKRHQQGIVKSQLEGHLNKRHQEYVWGTRRKIVQAVQEETSLQPWAATQDEVIYPGPDAAPLPHLPVYHDGLQCSACPYINRSIKRIRDHCREEHRWEDQRQPSDSQSGTQAAWRIVSCQKLHSRSKFGRLFQVSADAAVPHTGDSADMDVSQAIESSLSQATTQLDAWEKQKNATVRADTDRYDFSEWLNRAGWARHLRGLKRDWLLAMARKPTPKERGLFNVCWAARMVMWRAQQASKASVVGMPAVMYINRRELGNTTNEKPLNAEQLGKTMIKYSNVWLEIIAYVWRTHELPVVTPGNSEEEVAGKRPPYHISAKQHMFVEKIKWIVGKDKEEDWFDEMATDSDDTDTDTDTDDDDDDDRLDEEQEEALEGLVLQFMLSLLDHTLGDSEYRSALISAMAVLGISAESGWLSPMVYLPKQSAVVTTSRMLVLYRSTQLRQEQVNRLVNQGWESGDAADIAPPHLEFVQEMAKRFMTLTEYNGKPTPMDYILKLRAFGFKIRFTTNAEGVVDWAGDKLLYGNIQFTMPQLRSMIHGMIASARQQMMTDLMLLQVDGEGGVALNTTACPAIDWERLVDNGAETKVGWSFMEDPRNKHATSVEEPKQWLGQRLQGERKLREAFVDVEATRSALARGEGVVWAQDRVRTYGQAMKEARRMLAALVHMTGGAPPRGSELVSIKHRNSANGDSRGIFIEDGAVVFVTKYHKNVGQTGKGKVIHRYMPREVGELVVYYLWFVSPFWRQINRAACGKAVEGGEYVWEPQPERRWAMPVRKRGRSPRSSSRSGKRARSSAGPAVSQDAWEEGVDDGEPAAEQGREVELWNSNRVKQAIRKEGLQHMGVPLHILSWRHSTKAIYRRYIDNAAAVKACLDADESEDESEDKPWDIQTGHSSSVAGGIYGRPINEPIFSVESKRWGLRVASMEWHAFLQLPSAVSKKPRRGTHAAAVRREAVEEEYRRWKLMRLVDVDSELKTLLGERAAFRSVQKPAVQAIMQHKSPVRPCRAG